MKSNLIILFLVCTQFLDAQTFTEVPSAPPFDGVAASSIAFSDVNGDGTNDVLITGSKEPFGARIAKLYTNDGLGNFTEMTGTPFDGVLSSFIAFSDVNGDGTDDVLITGRNSSDERIAKLYTNDGLGSFTEMMGTPFDGVWAGSIAFSDVNGDSTADVLVTGKNNSDELIAKLYTNDGLGNFTEMTGTPFDGVVGGCVAFSDVNGDGTDDVLITGWNSSDELIAKLYTNDGLGNFTEMMGIPLDGVSVGSIAFSDVNGDGTDDVLITGEREILGERIAKLYTNDGLGNFTEMTNTPFEGVRLSPIAFSDVNGDGSNDVLITGENNANEIITKLYTNDGLGNFTEMTGTPFDGVHAGDIAFSDVNGDGSADVLITGANSSDERITKLYTNDGLGNFTKMTGTPFDGVLISSIAFSDVNGDGTDDVLITGEREILGERIAKLYTNDGLGNFTEMMDTPFDGVTSGSIAFSDVNGDGTADVLITGVNSPNERIAKLYINDGLGNFTEMMDTPFDAVWSSFIAFSDVNGDGSEDVLIIGDNSFGERIAKLYTNDGLGNFTEMMDTPFEGGVLGSIAFSDVNGDGSNDVLITGLNSSDVTITRLYTNDGLGNFTEMTDTPFDGVWVSSIAFSDVNGDGSADVLITGQKGLLGEQITKLYTNDGLGNFTEMTGTPFDGVFSSSIAFSDVNGDGTADVLITGANNSHERIAKLYTNDGLGNFTEIMETPFEGVSASSIAFSDVNGDGTADVLITGRNSSDEGIAKLYTNDAMVSSIDDLKFGMSLNFILFPNPSSSSTLFLSYASTEMSEVSIKLYNVNGLLLIQQKEFAATGQQTYSVDISSLPKGNYFLELDNGKNREIAKFIVQ